MDDMSTREYAAEVLAVAAQKAVESRRMRCERGRHPSVMALDNAALAALMDEAEHYERIGYADIARAALDYTLGARRELVGAV